MQLSLINPSLLADFFVGYYSWTYIWAHFRSTIYDKLLTTFLMPKSDELCRRTSCQSGTSCGAARSTATISSTPVRSSRHHDACGLQSAERRREYVKKPLNAFMLFMKEKRQRVIEECTLKESAAINQILGRKVSIAAQHFFRIRIRSSRIISELKTWLFCV